ncbi:hypothetical protein ACWEQP_31765 [Streptomyces sp. NPDC004044]
MTTLFALALAACGAERAGGSDSKAAPGARAEAASAAPSRAGAEDAGFLAFMDLLNSVAKPCEKHLPPAGPVEEPPASGPPTTPLPELPVPQEAPPTGELRDPEAAKKEVELSPFGE